MVMDGESQSLNPVPLFGLPPPTPVQRSILQAYQSISLGIFEVLLTPLPWRATVMPSGPLVPPKGVGQAAL